jgi:hypothetical protein
MNSVLRAKLELIRMIGTVDRAILSSERAWRISFKDDFNKDELSIRTHIDSLSYDNPLPVVISNPEITSEDMSDAICDILDGFEIEYKIKTCSFPLQLRNGSYGEADGYIILASRKMIPDEINILESMSTKYYDEFRELTSKNLEFFNKKLAGAMGIPTALLNGLGGISTAPNANGNSFAMGFARGANRRGLLSTPNSTANALYELWQEALKKGMKP